MSDNETGKDFELDLDMSLDDIEDLPGFTQLPTGSYTVLLHKGIETKEINEKPSAVCELVVQQILELEEKNLDEDEDPPKTGDIFTVNYMLDNPTGVGFMKEFMKPLVKGLSLDPKGSIRELWRQTKGAEVMITCTRKFDKKHGKNFTRINKIAVV